MKTSEFIYWLLLSLADFWQNRKTDMMQQLTETVQSKLRKCNLLWNYHHTSKKSLFYALCKKQTANVDC